MNLLIHATICVDLEALFLVLKKANLKKVIYGTILIRYHLQNDEIIKVENRKVVARGQEK